MDTAISGNGKIEYDVEPIAKDQEKLTPKQEALCEIVFNEYDDLLSHPRRINQEAVSKWINFIYSDEYKIKVPPIKVVSSPKAAMDLATQNTGETVTSTDNCGISEAGWVSFYDYWHRTKVLTDSEWAESKLLKDFIFCAYDTLLLDELAIVIEMPVSICRDGEGRLHNENGPSIEWSDGEKGWNWHGEKVPERIIMSPGTYTAKEFQDLPAEHRRALGEHLGWSKILELLGSIVVDSCVADGLSYSLLQCTDGTKYLDMQSPVLKNGSQPHYIEPVHEDLNTAAGARKWRIPMPNGIWLSAHECDENPLLKITFHT